VDCGWTRSDAAVGIPSSALAVTVRSPRPYFDATSAFRSCCRNLRRRATHGRYEVDVGLELIPA
jgi:hypothetical protein